MVCARSSLWNFAVCAWLMPSHGCDSNGPGRVTTTDGATVSIDGGSASYPDGSDLETPAICTSAACGGDLVGEWAFSSECAPERPNPMDSCSPSQNTFFALSLDGRVSFLDDGTAEYETRLLQMTYVWVPKSCLRAGQTCETAVTAVPPVMGSCADTGGYCDCVTYTDDPLEAETVSYEVHDNELVLDTSEGVVNFQYCVRNDWLRYVHESGEATVARRVE